MTAKELRASILDLAIRGKLVPQDPNDEPAEKLLARIAAEKAKLVKSGKLKNGKPLPPITDDDKPFDLPRGWVWSRMEDAFEIARGGSPRPIQEYLTTASNGLNWIKIGDTVKGSKYINSVRERIRPEGLSKTRLVHRGDLLLTNSMSFGEAYILNVDGCIHDGWLVLHPRSPDIDREYFLYVLASAFVLTQFNDLAAGGIVQNLNSDKVKSLIVPLPPLAEQKRIVEKIEQLMPLVERYGQAEEKRRQLITALPEALKKSILKSAVEGKLVPQDQSDEPAEKLLARIAAEKAKLIKSGNLKKEKPLPPIADDEKPFDLPHGWAWCRMEDVFEIARGGSPRPIQEYLTTASNGLNWIKIGDTVKGSKYINSVRERIRPEGLSKTRQVHRGDLLLTNSMSFGEAYILNVDGCIHDGWLVLHPRSSDVDREYFLYVLASAFVLTQFNDLAAGGIVQNLNSDKVKSLIVPIPPHVEQKRIVARVEELLGVVAAIKKMFNDN